MLNTLTILYTDVSIGIDARESVPVEILEKCFILIKLIKLLFTVLEKERKTMKK